MRGKSEWVLFCPFWQALFVVSPRGQRRGEGNWEEGRAGADMDAARINKKPPPQPRVLFLPSLPCKEVPDMLRRRPAADDDDDGECNMAGAAAGLVRARASPSLLLRRREIELAWTQMRTRAVRRARSTADRGVGSEPSGDRVNRMQDRGGDMELIFVRGHPRTYSRPSFSFFQYSSTNKEPS